MQETETKPDLVDFDHHSLAFAADPFGTAAKLREVRHVRSEEHGGFVVAARYEDVHRTALDAATYTNGRDTEDPIKLGVQLPPSEAAGNIPEESDAPYHTAYRRAMAPYFTTRAAKASEARLQHWTDVCLDEVVEKGTFDVVTEMTGPIAFLFFCEMLGLPVEEWRRWYEPLHELQTTTPNTPEQRAAIDAERENGAVMEQYVRDRREQPQDDLISRLAEARGPDGELFTVAEVAAMSRIIILGAVDSVGSLVSQAVNYLADHPDEADRMVAEPEYMDSAIEEFLRYFSPGVTTMRTVGLPTTFGPHPLAPGARMMIMWLAANHDPEVFEDPDELVLDRAPNKHVAFGAGVHKCIGLHYARMEARVFLKELLTRMRGYEVVPEGTEPLKTIGLFTGFHTLQIRFTPGERVQDDRMPGRIAA
jgi:cytochrome P450